MNYLLEQVKQEFYYFHDFCKVSRRKLDDMGFELYLVPTENPNIQFSRFIGSPSCLSSEDVPNVYAPAYEIENVKIERKVVSWNRRVFVPPELAFKVQEVIDFFANHEKSFEIEYDKINPFSTKASRLIHVTAEQRVWRHVRERPKLVYKNRYHYKHTKNNGLRSWYRRLLFNDYKKGGMLTLKFRGYAGINIDMKMVAIVDKGGISVDAGYAAAYELLKGMKVEEDFLRKEASMDHLMDRLSHNLDRMDEYNRRKFGR